MARSRSLNPTPRKRSVSGWPRSRSASSGSGASDSTHFWQRSPDSIRSARCSLATCGSPCGAKTELSFDDVMCNDRSLLELIDSNSTFLNEVLAKHYGIDGVAGKEMRRVELPAGSLRGGLLTQGTLLVVTSNPTRTSPGKRGLFILENVLGVAPAAAAGASAAAGEGGRGDHRPRTDDSRAARADRQDPLCHSCHARMDPLAWRLRILTPWGCFGRTRRGSRSTRRANS